MVLRSPEADLNVPALCDVEIVAGLRRAVSRNVAKPGRAELALSQYLDLPLIRHGHQSLLSRALELRENFGAYDACYVALAERLEAELLTADESLSRAVRTHTRLVCCLE
jgi:predicted nucleic acid-binding protein